MRVKKYMIFVVGMSAGIASMVAFSHLSQSQKPVETIPAPQDSIQQSAAPESPFSVVDESPDATAEPEPEPEPEADIEFLPLDTAALMQRIENAESRIEALESELADVQSQQFLPDDNSLTENEQTEVLSSVFEPATVTDIQTIRNDIQLQRLDLRDRAIREGWINTDRFREESRALRSGSQLRETLGDDDYDKLLAAEGRDNRVQIESIIENSAADLSGIEEGDVIVRYADERIFQFRELRDRTTEGVRDESVNIQVSRNGELIDLVIPRGPMGVTLDALTEQPSE